MIALVARGLTDAQIGLELGISPHTVRKHVEHILERLHARTRTAAAAVYLTGTELLPTAWTASEARLVS